MADDQPAEDGRGRHAAPDDQRNHPPAPAPASFAIGSPPATARDVVERAADIALAASPLVLRVLDVGCGDGSLLRELVLRVPYAETYCGVDPDAGRLALAMAAPDARLDYRVAAAEALPFADDFFDLVTTMRSLHLWRDQAAGVAELARVLRPSGRIVVIDRLPDGPAGAGRIRSRAGLRAAAEATGLRMVSSQSLTRRLLVRGGVCAYVLAGRTATDQESP